MSKYQIEVLRLSDSPVEVIRALRTIGRMSLERATRLFHFLSNTSGAVLVAGVDEDVASVIAEQLSLTGSDVRMSVSSLSWPLVCDPDVNAKYVWQPLKLLKRVAR